MSPERLQGHGGANRVSLTAAIVLAPTLILIVGFTGSVAWVRDPSPILLLIVAAGLIALALSVSRFRPLHAHAIAVGLSLGLVLLAAGRVVPNLGNAIQRPIEETLWLMNVRLWTVLDDLARGVGLLGSGSFPGVAFATAAYGFLAWHTVHALVWSGFRRRTPWPAVFLCFALLVARDALSSRPPSWSLGMTFGVLLVAARGVYASRIDAWERRGLGTSIDLWERWAASLVGVSIVVFVVTGLTTPEWRKTIDDFFDTVRSTPERTASAPRQTGSSPPAASSVPDVGLIGAPFPKGDRTVMYVTTSDPPPEDDPSRPRDSSGRGRYWRVAIYDRYTGRGWEMAPLGGPAPLADEAPGPDPSRAVVLQRFNILAVRGDRLFAANQAVEAFGGPRVLVVGDDEQSTLLEGTEAEYAVVSWVPDVTREQLSAAGTDYPATIRSSYLHRPERIPRRVIDLAARISDGAQSAFEKAARIQAFLREGYPYRDDIAPPPPGRDVVDYFLFDAPEGFCSYYASAMVVLLRLEGVPARVVTGFAGGIWDEREGRFRVPESNAHAWVEVYFPGLGWVEFEPTPSRPALDYASEAPSIAPPAVVVEPRLTSRGPSVLLPWAASVTAVALAAAFGAWLWDRDQPRPDQVLHTLYWRMRRRLSTEIQPNLTPSEFLSLHEPRTTSHPNLKRTARMLTSMYVRATYGPDSTTPQDAESARRAWRSAWWDRLRWKRPNREEQ
ncbi:MAG TPA: transglutaminase domain-containing protein [Anaerolineales bacterium]|nr:transglutaminase domain-containing protein [Anaerolineales bacterium]